MNKVAIIYNMDTNTIENAVLITKDHLPRIELKAEAAGIDFQVDTKNDIPGTPHDLASDEAIQALRDKLSTAPTSRESIWYEGPRTSEVITELPASELCHDDWSGRYFMSTINEIEKAVAWVNSELRQEGSVELNSYYDQVGLSTIQAGARVGWSGEEISARFGASLSPQGRPAINVWFDREPNLDRKWHG